MGKRWANRGQRAQGVAPSAKISDDCDGVLVTSACLDSSVVLKSVIRILRDYVPAFSPVNEEYATLEDELAALAKGEDRLIAVPTNVRGFVFVGWTRDPRCPSANTVVDNLRKALADGRSFYQLSRIYPILATSGFRTAEIHRGTTKAVTVYLTSLNNADSSVKDLYTKERPLLINVSATVRNNAERDSRTVEREASNAVVEAAQSLGWHVSVMPAASDAFLIINICRTTVYYTMRGDDCKASYTTVVQQ